LELELSDLTKTFEEMRSDKVRQAAELIGAASSQCDEPRHQSGIVGRGPLP
jgi:hypothetical protein